jgi:hypothetical protein
MVAASGALAPLIRSTSGPAADPVPAKGMSPVQIPS